MSENIYRISLLIPSFNSGATLSKTLSSIRKQSFSGVEVILIDGLSSDNTLNIAEVNKDLITIVVSEPDKGIYDAINKGISLASGNLICVVGSDDELCQMALESIYQAWSDNRTDIVAGRTVLVSPDGTEASRVDEDYGLGALLSGIPFGHNAMFVTPEAYNKVGQYNLNYRICADADWVHRAIRLGCTCAQIDVPVVRFGLEGLSSTNPDKIMMETYQIISRNFDGLSLTDAESLFREIRGWSNGADVNTILDRYVHIPSISEAFNVAIVSREKRRGNNKLTPIDVSVPKKNLISYACRVFAKFKSALMKIIK